MILGALPQEDASRQDLAKARAELAASGVGGRAGDARVSERPDDQRRAVRDARAEGAGQACERAGFDVALAGSPVATFQPKFRAGQVAFGIWLWAPDYPDPADYLVFTPGN